MKISTPLLQCAPVRRELVTTAAQTANTVWFDPNMAVLLAGANKLAGIKRANDVLQAVTASPDDLRTVTAQALEAVFPTPLVAAGVLPSPEEWLTNSLKAHAPALGEGVQIVSLGVAGWQLWHDWSGQTPGRRAWEVVKLSAQAADLLCEHVPALQRLAPGLATVGLIVKIGDEFCTLTPSESASGVLPTL